MRKCLLIWSLLLLLPAMGQNRFSKDKTLQGIYAMQDQRNSAGLQPYLSNRKEKYRLAAVMAYASVQDTAVAQGLLLLLSTDKSHEVRKAAAYSLGQLYRPWLLKQLIAEFPKQKKTDVKNEILEAIGKCANKDVLPFFEGLEVSRALQLGFVRGVYFAGRRKVKSDLLLEKIKLVSKETQEPALLHLCTRILSLPKPEAQDLSGNRISISMDLAKDTMQSLANPYRQVDFLKKYNFAPEDLYQLTFLNYAYPVKTYCMETYLQTVKKVDKARAIYILNSGNIAFISLICEKIRKDTLWAQSDSFALPVLRYIAAHLDVPKDLETWLDVQKTIAFISGKPFEYTAVPYLQHPIDWNFVLKIPEGQKVRIKTNKGDIILLCKVNDAPGSVGNFLKLVDSGYYNNKYFHRMVPDFVVQGGCPRGDGWGSLDWVQRSEFSNWLRYKPGSVGLASAGKDSEGVQIFITHTYTSNLDGRYSIFAEVVDGMDIVNSLIVGDQIISIERI